MMEIAGLFVPPGHNSHTTRLAQVAEEMAFFIRSLSDESLNRRYLIDFHFQLSDLIADLRLQHFPVKADPPSARAFAISMWLIQRGNSEEARGSVAFPVQRWAVEVSQTAAMMRASDEQQEQ